MSTLVTHHDHQEMTKGKHAFAVACVVMVVLIVANGAGYLASLASSLVNSGMSLEKIWHAWPSSGPVAWIIVAVVIALFAAAFYVTTILPLRNTQSGRRYDDERDDYLLED